MEGRAYAVPTTINYTPDSPDLDERRGQPHRSAMVRPRPGGTTFVIIVTSAPSKFNDGTISTTEFDPKISNNTIVYLRTHSPNPFTDLFLRRGAIQLKGMKHTINQVFESLSFSFLKQRHSKRQKCIAFITYYYTDQA